MAGINPPSKFKDISEIADEAVKMDDISAMIQFVEEENNKLNYPVPEDNLARLLNEISNHIRAAQNEFNYRRCVEELSQIKLKVELKDRILQATEFVNSIVLSKDGNLQDMGLFIECEVFDYFNIPKGKNDKMGQIFRNGYRDIIKAKKKELSNKKKTVANADAHTFDIDSEFEDLYQVSESETGNITIKPFYDMIAKYVSDKLHVISFHGNMFIYKEGCYKIDPYTIKAEATRVLNGIMKNENSRDISKRLTDLMTYIQNYNVVNEYPFYNHNNAFPVRNGVIVFDFENVTHRLEENPDPDTWKFDYVLDVDYNSKADSSYILSILQQYLYIIQNSFWK